MKLVFALLLLTLPAANAAAEPTFVLPLACEMGTACFIQNYVDADPSAAATDFTCGSLSYEQHKGTDIRLRNYVDMDKGVAVLAAAPGTVLRLRDGMVDVNVRDIGLEAIKDRMAGNSVIIDHGDGWVTQYAHMKNGSIAVTPGQEVAAGDVIGEVGLSGNTEFPHLHFEVRHNDQVVDPFTGEQMGAGCGKSAHPLWQASMAKEVAYRPTGLLGRGFAVAKPEAEAARHGAYSSVIVQQESAALVYWVDLFGLQANDRLVLELSGPNGRIAASDDVIPRSKAAYFAFVGAKKPSGGWAPGIYSGSLRVERGGKVAVQDAVEVTLP